MSQRCGQCGRHVPIYQLSACGRCMYELDFSKTTLGIEKTLLDSEISRLRKALENCKTEVTLQKSQIEGLQSSLAFLRIQVNDNEQVDGSSKVDVTIVVQGRKDDPLHAHKLILARRSSVFCKMLNTKMPEGETGMIQIDDTTLPVMRAVIKFCYSAEIDFTDEVTAEDVLVVAHKYAIDLLQTRCEEHLIKTIDRGNALRRLKIAKKFEAKDLHAAALSYWKSNFDEFIEDVLN